MAILDRFVFFKDANTPAYSNIYINGEAKILSIQISGNNTGFSAIVETKIDSETDEYNTVSCVSDVSFDIFETIINNGNYTVPIEGRRYIRINLNSINSGTISVYGLLSK